MGDKILKYINKISVKDKLKLLEVIRVLEIGDLSNVEYIKLSGEDNLYRIRVGNHRVIFKKISEGKYIVLSIKKRDENTY